MADATLNRTMQQNILTQQPQNWRIASMCWGLFRRFTVCTSLIDPYFPPIRTRERQVRKRWGGVWRCHSRILSKQESHASTNYTSKKRRMSNSKFSVLFKTMTWWEESRFVFQWLLFSRFPAVVQEEVSSLWSQDIKLMMQLLCGLFLNST